MGAGDSHLSADASVRELLAPIMRYADLHEGVTEVVVNRAGQVYIEHGAEWTAHDAPELTVQKLNSLVTSIGSYTNQVVTAKNPLLSADLPGGERMQIAIMPVVARGTMSLTIRIPAATVRPLEQYEADGVFKNYKWSKTPRFESGRTELGANDELLCKSLENRDLRGFLENAAKFKKTIAFVGDTGSGKTSLMKSLCLKIPLNERLVTIEDVRELFLPHDNKVHLLYSKGGQGTAAITPADLIATCMRMNPSRVLLAELRGGEAYDMLKLLTTGHRGSITSFHADSCALAFERFVFMCKEHADAQVYTAADLKRLFSLTFDVIAHIEVVDIFDESGTPIRRERRITEVYFDPVAKAKVSFE